jgi:diguanylate cyclase (GGDEF)-like protein
MNQSINTISSYKSKIYIILLGSGLVLLLGALDSLIDYRVSFSIFYVLPVVLVTWYAGFMIGIIFSILSTCMWFFAATVSRNHQIPLAILSWNSVVRLGFFIIISSVLHYFKSERENARIDFLTRISNRRHFEETLLLETERSARYKHPLTVVYMDIDNFKMINDNLGHHEGDKLLVTVSSVMKNAMRSSDLISRIGGDEFAFILIETDEQQAKRIINKIKLELLRAMESKTWPVAFSFGVVTFHRFPKTTREMLKIADDCMYNAKQAGKNTIKMKVVK